MKSMLRMMLVAAAATLMVTGAFAQTKTAPPTAPKGAKPANPKAPQAAPPKAPPKAMGDKFWGTTTKDAVKDGKFVFGSADPKKKGQFTVDTKGAKITDKAGKFFSVNNIKPGSSVTVMGKATGMTIKATAVTVNFVPGTKPATAPTAPKAGSVKPTSSKPAAGKPAAGTKPPVNKGG